MFGIALAAQAATPSPAPYASCNYPPHADRLAPAYISPSLHQTFPGLRDAVVAVTVDPSGKVIEAKIVRGAAEPFMNSVAVESARHSTYSAGAANCEPVGGTIEVTIPFQLGDYQCDREASVVQAVQAKIPRTAWSGLPSGTQRTATVRVRIGEDGKLMSAIIATSTGNSIMDHAALQAARESTYAPKIVNCHPQATEALFEVTFDNNGPG